MDFLAQLCRQCAVQHLGEVSCHAHILQNFLCHRERCIPKYLKLCHICWKLQRLKSKEKGRAVEGVPGTLPLTCVLGCTKPGRSKYLLSLRRRAPETEEQIRHAGSLK